MISIAFALTTLLSLLLCAVLTTAAPLEPRGYVAYAPYAGFTRITDAASLQWYQPYKPTGVNTAVVTNPVPYKCYNGQSAAYPYVTSWRTFDTMWAINLPTLAGVNSAANNALLRQKIVDMAGETRVDARLILAIIMQESTGQLAVQCTALPIGNCGIMQGAPGGRGFDPASPALSIDRMIRNGVLGQAGSWPVGGPGFAWLFNGANGEAWVKMGGGGHPYRALRAYNSGHVENQANLDVTGSGGVRSYVNDVANRLMGWNGKGRGCGYY